MTFYEKKLTVVDSLPNANLLRPELCTKVYARMYFLICNNDMVSQTTALYPFSFSSEPITFFCF